MNFARLLVLSVLALGLAGCGTATFVIQQYDGPQQPRERVAILRIRGDQNVRLIALDGADANAAIASDVRLHVEVMPGRHTLDVANAEAPTAPVQRVAFVAEAGRSYGVAFVRAGAAGAARPRVYELREDSDAPLRDVTIVKPEAPVELAR